jgi:hypothetical protein
VEEDEEQAEDPATAQNCTRDLPLNPRDAYYGGRTNAISLYKKCVGEEKIRYIDVVSMYPTVMSLTRVLVP